MSLSRDPRHLNQLRVPPPPLLFLLDDVFSYFQPPSPSAYMIWLHFSPLTSLLPLQGCSPMFTGMPELLCAATRSCSSGLFLSLHQQKQIFPDAFIHALVTGVQRNDRTCTETSEDPEDKGGGGQLFQAAWLAGTTPSLLFCSFLSFVPFLLWEPIAG